MLKRKRYFLYLGILLVATVLTALVSGAVRIPIWNCIKIVLHKIPITGKYVDVSDISTAHIAIISNIRLPRVVLAFLVGVGLSMSGTALQGLLKNPMADPYIIGTSSGAALGAAVAILMKVNTSLLGMGAVSIFAFIGAIVATFLVYYLARFQSKVPVTILLLAGIAVGQFFTAIMSFIMVMSSKDMANIVFWTMGSFSSRGWNHVQIAFIPILMGSVILYFHSKDLNLLLLGEDTAQNTGVEVEKVKKWILIISALITAFCVSVSGIIGFVGLIVPHIARMIVGPDHRVLIPVSILSGGIFLMLADTFARTIIAPTEIPVGIITALCGGPFFIYLLRKTKKVI